MPHLEDHFFRYAKKCHPNKTWRKKEVIQKFQVLLFLSQNHSLPKHTLLDYKKLVKKKIFKPSYLLFYEIQDRKKKKEKNLIALHTSKYQIGKILLSLERSGWLRGCRKSRPT